MPQRIKESFLLVEPQRIIAALRKNIPLIILSMLLFSALGGYIAIKKESKSWSAASKIIRYSKQVSQSKDVPYQFQNFNYETALETIRTRSNLIELIKRLNLSETMTPETLFSQFEIKRGRNSDIVEIIFTTQHQELAAKGANTLSNIFIENFYRVQNAATEKIYSYYNKNRDVKEQELLVAKEAINMFLKENNTTSLENSLENNYKLLNKLEQQKLQNKIKIAEYTTTIKSMKLAIQELPKEVKLRYSIRSVSKKALDLKQNELNKQREVYTDEHPIIKMLQSEVEQIKQAIKADKVVEPDEVTYGMNPLKSNLHAKLDGLKVKLKTAKDIETSLNTQMESIQKRLESLNQLHKQYAKLKRKQAEIKQELSILTKRMYDLKMSIGSSKEDFKLFEPAKYPIFPNRTYKKVIVILFSILGVFLALLIVIVKEFLDNSVKTKFDLEERFGITDTVQFKRERELSSVTRQSFSSLANTIIEDKTEKTHIITLGSDVKPKKEQHITTLLLEQLIYQKKKVLLIESSDVSTYADTQSIDLDTHTFKPQKQNEYLDKLYWYMKDDYNIFIPNKEKLNQLMNTFKKLGYDYIIVNAPAYKDAELLIPMLIENTDAFLLCTEFKTSQRRWIQELMLKLETKNLDKIKGIISETHKYFLY
jgi:uncharacterized protein involved in exopolysaccharide biosynthesis